MTRHELKNLILECIDEKMEDIVNKITDKNSQDLRGDKTLDIKESMIDLRRDINYIAGELKISYGDLPSSDLPF